MLVDLVHEITNQRNRRVSEIPTNQNDALDLTQAPQSNARRTFRSNVHPWEMSGTSAHVRTCSLCESPQVHASIQQRGGEAEGHRRARGVLVQRDAPLHLSAGSGHPEALHGWGELGTSCEAFHMHPNKEPIARDIPDAILEHTSMFGQSPNIFVEPAD